MGIRRVSSASSTCSLNAGSNDQPEDGSQTRSLRPLGSSVKPRNDSGKWPGFNKFLQSQRRRPTAGQQEPNETQSTSATSISQSEAKIARQSIPSLLRGEAIFTPQEARLRIDGLSPVPTTEQALKTLLNESDEFKSSTNGHLVDDRTYQTLTAELRSRIDALLDAQFRTALINIVENGSALQHELGQFPSIGTPGNLACLQYAAANPQSHPQRRSHWESPLFLSNTIILINQRRMRYDDVMQEFPNIIDPAALVLLREASLPYEPEGKTGLELWNAAPAFVDTIIKATKRSRLPYDHVMQDYPTLRDPEALKRIREAAEVSVPVGTR